MNDEQAMRLALAQAQRAVGRTAPNPPVGAVVFSRSGELIGQGFTQPAGGAHAEIMAIRGAQANGHDLQGASMVVTLEPCCHHGRTPPCTDAILAAGFSRVVIGVVDPFPAVSGGGIAALRAGGVEVVLGVLANEAADVMRGFLRVTTGGLPHVTAKIAMSLTGALATAGGESQWITGEAARAHAHAERARHDAVLVGIGTVLADDPRLTARGTHDAPIQPVPVVLDSGLRIPAQAALLQRRERAIILTTDDTPERRDLQADIVRVAADAAGRVEPHAALKALGERGLHRVLVEGGAQVHRSLIDAGVVDDLLVYVAPVLIAGGRSWLGGRNTPELSDALRIGSPTVEALGDDVLLRYRLSRAPAEEG